MSDDVSRDEAGMVASEAANKNIPILPEAHLIFRAGDRGLACELSKIKRFQGRGHEKSHGCRQAILVGAGCEHPDGAKVIEASGTNMAFGPDPAKGRRLARREHAGLLMHRLGQQERKCVDGWRT